MSAVEWKVASVPVVSFAPAVSAPSNIAFCLNQASPVMSAIEWKEAVSSIVTAPFTVTAEPNVAVFPTVTSFSAVSGASSPNIAFPLISTSSAIVTSPLNVPFPPIFRISPKIAIPPNSAFPFSTVKAPVA